MKYMKLFENFKESKTMKITPELRRFVDKQDPHEMASQLIESGMYDQGDIDDLDIDQIRSMYLSAILSGDINVEISESYDEDEQRWVIYAGLGGGFGGAQLKGYFVGSKDDAEDLAYQKALEEYESYAGMHGLRDVDEIMQDEGIEDYDEAEVIYNEEREDWIEYHAEKWDDNKDYSTETPGGVEISEIHKK